MLRKDELCLLIPQEVAQAWLIYLGKNKKNQHYGNK